MLRCVSLVYTLTLSIPSLSLLFFFNNTATTEIYTLSLHDALPIYWGGEKLDRRQEGLFLLISIRLLGVIGMEMRRNSPSRSEEHTSELQSRQYLVCRLLLEKKKKKSAITSISVSMRRDIVERRFVE